MSPHRVDTAFERFFDGLPTANFRIFVAVVTSFLVTMSWTLLAAFGKVPPMWFVGSTYTFLLGWMGIETWNHLGRRKTDYKYQNGGTNAGA